jgi:hypothetical protein
MTDNEKKYSAFLSYSQQDNRGQRTDAPAASHRCWGDWLRDALKSFSIPAEFIGQINGRGEIIPERIDVERGNSSGVGTIRLSGRHLFAAFGSKPAGE